MPSDLSLWLVHPDPDMIAAFRSRFAGLPGVVLHACRFEELPPHDCFVTAGNSFGMMTAGIDAAVVHFFGQIIMRLVQREIVTRYLGEQPVGTAFLIETGHAAIPYLVHAPTMRVPTSIEGTTRIHDATWASLLAVHAHNQHASTPIRTVAFPAFGTGFGGVPFDEAARQIAVAYRHYLEPPTYIDWDLVIARQKALCYDGTKQVAR